MASSRASTPAGRRRTAKRDAAAKPASRKRPGTAHKPAGAKKAATKKAAPKAKAKPAPKPKPKSSRPKTARPKAAPATPGYLLSRSVTVAFVVGTLTLGLAAAYFFWFKNSSFVAVQKVTVDGIEGPEAAAVTGALTRSGEGMTTLNVDETVLASAVSGYPTVVAIQAEADFPHGLTVHVTDRPPVLNASDGGPPVPIAADGSILRGVDASDAGIPDIEVDALPVKGKLEGGPLALAQIAGAAPEPLRPLIDGLAINEGDGIEVTLEGGIPVMFGDPDAAQAKWAAVAAVLANPQVKTLTRLDVRVPERPSIGGAAPAETTG
jgi:cell division protein FtsQ